MQIVVYGLWHLGLVTAASLASKNFPVTGIDPDSALIDALNCGNLPIYEPGLADLTEDGIKHNRLTFVTDKEAPLSRAAIVWVTFDTPVDENDHADTQFVSDKIKEIFPLLANKTTVIISSQMKVGATVALQTQYDQLYPNKDVTFTYIPENLRLGQAIDCFLRPDRIVVGTPNRASTDQLQQLLRPLTDNITWMSIASAEMTKHAINAFLATSVTFANELATLCEQVGADAQEVKEGLITEKRIGKYAYLGPGSAFSGGTLARDVTFLNELKTKYGKELPLVSSIHPSNDRHKLWAYNKLNDLFDDLRGKTVGVLGLTYKPGTNTLRRSGAIDICHKLAAAGVIIQAFDPMINQLPSDLSFIRLTSTADECAASADALLVLTPWQDFKQLNYKEMMESMEQPIVIDPHSFLTKEFNQSQFSYYSVGRSLCN